MAEGCARVLFGSHAIASSAGTRPLHVNPYAIAVMREHGVDLRSHRAKSVATIDASAIDLVVRVCADAICPPGLAHLAQLQWAIPDPASDDPAITDEEMLVRFRSARDAIRIRVLELAASIRDHVAAPARAS